MKCEILLFIQILLVGLSSCRNVGVTCQTESDCFPWLACVDNVCEACRKVGTVCEPNATGFLSTCCTGYTCEEIPGLNGTSQCRPNNNNCLTDKDCLDGLNCLFRLGKCGICHKNGQKCTLPYDNLECCSSYCKFIENDVGGECSDPKAMYKFWFALRNRQQ